MDIPNPARYRPTKPSPSERFLGAYPLAPPPITNLTSAPDLGDELTEDDILWTNDFAAESNHHHQNSHHNNNNNHSTPPFSASSTPRRHHKGFSQPESFGILAALPDREDASSPNSRSHSHFYRKASASSSSSSSSSPSSRSSSSPSYAQMIPTIPKPPPLQDHHHHRSFSSSFKYQSAPVNIPVLMRKKYELEAVADEEDDDSEMLPPHEIVARSSAHSPMVAYSVLEGVGRTLKGRDLRRVRNAVWRRTGFLD